MATDSFSFPQTRDPDRFIPKISRRKGIPWPISTLILWQDRARMRDQLSTTPPELLRDMGIDPILMRAECTKPFWRR